MTNAPAGLVNRHVEFNYVTRNYFCTKMEKTLLYNQVFIGEQIRILTHYGPVHTLRQYYETGNTLCLFKMVYLYLKQHVQLGIHYLFWICLTNYRLYN